MRLLVVHDREEIRTKIKSLLDEEVGPDGAVDEAVDYLTARQLLTSKTYDLAVIDLTLPRRHGVDDASYGVAEDLVRDIIAVDDFNSPGDIIGITHDSSALRSLNLSIGPHLMTIIDENGHLPWDRLLRDRVQYVLRAGYVRQRSISRVYDFDIVIVTALDKERQPYEQLLQLVPDDRYPGASRFSVMDKDGIPRRGALLSIGRAGQSRSASTVQSLLNTYRPRFLGMSGICGGVKGASKLGDLILFETVYDWDYGKWRNKAGRSVFAARPEPITLRDRDIHLSLRSFIDQAESVVARCTAQMVQPMPSKAMPTMRLGQAASGSAVVGDAGIIDRIINVSDSIAAVDMEAYGAYVAAAGSNVIRPQFLCAKAVSDYCDGTKNDKHHAFCCEFSARALIEYFATAAVYPG